MTNYTHRSPSRFEANMRNRWDTRQARRHDSSRLETAAKAAVGTAAAVALTGLASKAYADPITTYRDLISIAVEHRHLGSSNITVNGIDPTQKIVLFAYKDRIDNGNPIRTVVGGIDNDYPDAPRTAGGHVNKDDNTYWGLIPGETIDGWFGGIDGGVDGLGVRNGNIGTFDLVTHTITFDRQDFISPEMITNFTGNIPFAVSSTYQDISLNITPEPMSGALLALGVGIIAGKRLANTARKAGSFIKDSVSSAYRKLF